MNGDLRGCRRSAFAGLIRSLYRFPQLRNICVTLALRTEGGRFRSGTLRELVARLHGVEVGAYSYGGLCLKPGVWPRGVSIGRYVSIAAGVRVFLRNHPMDHLSTHPFFFNANLGVVPDDGVEHGSLRIEHDAWIGENAIVLPGCSRIGVGAVVGAGSVVTKDIPDFAIVAGNPARVLRARFDDATQARVLESRWWDLSVEELAPFLEAFRANVVSDAKGASALQRIVARHHSRMDGISDEPAQPGAD